MPVGIPPIPSAAATTTATARPRGSGSRRGGSGDAGASGTRPGAQPGDSTVPATAFSLRWTTCPTSSPEPEPEPEPELELELERKAWAGNHCGGHGRCYDPMKNLPNRGARVTKQILFIEDDDHIRSLLVLSLQRDGFSVIEASSGEEGLAVFARTR